MNENDLRKRNDIMLCIKCQQTQRRKKKNPESRDCVKCLVWKRAVHSVLHIKCTEAVFADPGRESNSNSVLMRNTVTVAICMRYLFNNRDAY